MKIYRSRRVLSTGLKPLAFSGNPLDLHNSSYHIQPHAIIALSNYTALSSRQLKQNRFYGN